MGDFKITDDFMIDSLMDEETECSYEFPVSPLKETDLVLFEDETLDDGYPFNTAIVRFISTCLDDTFCLILRDSFWNKDQTFIEIFKRHAAINKRAKDCFFKVCDSLGLNGGNWGLTPEDKKEERFLEYMTILYTLESKEGKDFCFTMKMSATYLPDVQGIILGFPNKNCHLRQHFKYFCPLNQIYYDTRNGKYSLDYLDEKQLIESKRNEVLRLKNQEVEVTVFIKRSQLMELLRNKDKWLKAMEVHF